MKPAPHQVPACLLWVKNYFLSQLFNDNCALAHISHNIPLYVGEPKYLELYCHLAKLFIPIPVSL